MERTEPAPDDETALLRAGFDLYRQGRGEESAGLYRQALAINPDRHGALLMLGLILSAGDTTAEIEAESLFRRCLELSPDDFLALNHLGQMHQRRGEDGAAAALFERAVAAKPDFAPGFNNLGVSLHRQGRRRPALAAFERAVALAADLVAAQINRGVLLGELGRWDEAATAFRMALAGDSNSAEAWHHLGKACDHLNTLAEAEAAFRRAAALDPAEVDILVDLAATLERAGRDGEATEMLAEAARRQGIRVTACQGGAPEARILIVGARGSANVPTAFLFDRRRFETISLHLPPPASELADIERIAAGLPPCDVIFNAIGEAAADDPVLGQVSLLIERIGRPVLNPPERIPPTGRDRLPGLLAGIDGLLVPTTRRISRAELQDLADSGEIAGPLLVRPVGTHGGRDLCRVETAAQMRAALRDTRARSYFLSDFIDFKSADGFYRKYRFLFVDRQPFAYHLAIHTDWLIHYYRAEMSMAPALKAEEEAFLTDHQAAFPGRLGRAVGEVARRLDLDYGGMDCAVTADGRLLVFEANACMLLHLTDSAEEFAYKHRAVPRIVEAIADMVRRHRH